MEYSLKTVTEAFEKYKTLRFPLKIWILVNACGNRFLYWDASKTVVVVDRDGLEEYLQSTGSIFRCSKLATFFWLMDFYGFESAGEEPIPAEDEDKHILQYKHASFAGENRAYFEQLLRSRKQREVINQQNGNCSVHQPRILKNQKQCETGRPTEGATTTRSQLSSSSFAQEKFNLLMETKSLELSIREAYGNLNIGDDGLVPIIEVPETYCDKPAAAVPEYTKQRIIAGNYGRVNLEDLKRFFGNYLPVYDDSPEALNSKEPDEKPATDSEPTVEDDVEKVETPPASSQPASPLPPVNTLETFDYQDECMAGENQEPVAMFSELPLDMPMMVVEFPKDEEPLPLDEADSKDQGQLDETQFQLCADIRETFELLNEF